MVKEPVTLAPITVTEAPKAPRGAGFEAFEERRRFGFGNFIDSTELKRHGTLKLEDLLHGFPSIRIMQPPECPRRDMFCTRDLRMRVGRGGNIPWEQAFDLTNVRVGELKGVEIYRSAGEIPAEFNDTRAACGVLVLWTKP
jgi:hypothetical protein